MKIIGIDQSTSCTGITEFEVDEEFNIKDTKFYFTTTIKKYKENDLMKPFFIGKNSGFIKSVRIAEIINQNFFSNNDYVALEGYSYKSQSRAVFQLGELGGILKHELIKKEFNVRVYEPNSIKKFSTGKGNAGKLEMYLEYKKRFPNNEVIKYFDSYNKDEPNSPMADLIDSHFIALFLLTELKLRYGFIQLHSLKLHEIEQFNRVGPKQKENLLVRPFLTIDDI